MSIKAAIEHLIDAINNAKCSGSGNDWGEIEMAVHYARAELEKPELLMACDWCKLTTTPKLRDVSSSNYLGTRCGNCSNTLSNVRLEKWQWLYEEQQKTKGNT